ncbi:hypothetical protein [Nonomuraea sp. NPDC050310]|uniref:hypothetical protein n=1 Tax=Nonomuraea sp. NPDC050310 TaxID=3154935 RepID=UPI0033E701F4
MSSDRNDLSRMAGERALTKSPASRTPGDHDRAQYALTGERSGKKWCDNCGDYEATTTNRQGDDVCRDCA